jgi:hypothetical protein
VELLCARNIPFLQQADSKQQDQFGTNTILAEGFPRAEKVSWGEDPIASSAFPMLINGQHMNTAKLKLLFVVPLLAVGGCATQSMEHPVAREAIRHGKNPECFRIAVEDSAMRDAVHTARKTVPQFIAALRTGPMWTRGS